MSLPSQRVRQDAQQLGRVLPPGLQVHAGGAGLEAKQAHEGLGLGGADVLDRLADDLLSLDGPVCLGEVGMFGRWEQ
jgi:hypothetical protein